MKAISRHTTISLCFNVIRISGMNWGDNVSCYHSSTLSDDRRSVERSQLIYGWRNLLSTLLFTYYLLLDIVLRALLCLYSADYQLRLTKLETRGIWFVVVCVDSITYIRDLTREFIKFHIVSEVTVTCLLFKGYYFVELRYTNIFLDVWLIWLSLSKVSKKIFFHFILIWYKLNYKN